jgi:hypothetical protein
VATDVLLLDHETDLSVASSGDMVAVSVELPPGIKSNVPLFRVTPVTGMSVTVTMHCAVLAPSAVVTVMVAAPLETALTVAVRPLALTVATDVLLLDHVIFLFVAFDGWIVAVSVSLPPTGMSADVLLSATPVTAIVEGGAGSLPPPLHELNRSTARDMMVNTMRRKWFFMGLLLWRLANKVLPHAEIAFLKGHIWSLSLMQHF